MGSGKTTFSTLLAEHTGYQLVNGDVEAKRLMLSSAAVQASLTAAFGPEIIENGSLSFPRLGSIVFKNSKKLLELNRIVHPVLLDSLRNMIFSTGNKKIIIDAALIPMWGIEEWFNTRVWVEACAATRCDRICRKGLYGGTEFVQARMQIQEELLLPPPRAQWSYLQNDGEMVALEKYVTSFAASFVGNAT